MEPETELTLPATAQGAIGTKDLVRKLPGVAIREAYITKNPSAHQFSYNIFAYYSYLDPKPAASLTKVS